MQHLHAARGPGVQVSALGNRCFGFDLRHGSPKAALDPCVTIVLSYWRGRQPSAEFWVGKEHAGFRIHSRGRGEQETKADLEVLPEPCKLAGRREG